MLIIAYVPLLVALVGLLMWVLASNTTVKEAGKILFFCGVLVTLFTMAGEVVKIGGGKR